MFRSFIDSHFFFLTEKMILSTLQTPRSLSRLSLTRHSHSYTSRASLTDQTPTLTTSPPPHSEILSTRQTLLSRRASAADLALSRLARLRLVEPRLRAFLHLPDDDALHAQSRRLDARIAAGEDPGPLAGVLVGVKDNICTKDMPSTAGSRVLAGYRPPFDATAVKRVRELGGIVVGKTNMDEFGMGSTTEASAFQVLSLLILHLGFFYYGLYCNLNFLFKS